MSVYDQKELSAESQAKVKAYQDEYNKIKSEALASGIAENQLGQHAGIMDKLNAAHAAAEAERSGAASGGYSGGVDGSGYQPFSKDTIPNTNTVAASPQYDEIGSLTQAQKDAALAALKAAYDQNVIDTDAYAAKIPGLYQTARNQSSATAEQNRANFNEMAASRGLNSGVGGQADLAMRNQNTANMSGINSQEAQAKNDLETTRLKMSTKYQNDIAQAIAAGDMQKAQMLYAEAVRVDESLVAQSMAQADENYRYWAANNQVTQQQQASQKQQAETLAAFGDFSGFLAMGYTQENIDQMYRVWAAQNPLLAQAAKGGTPNFNYGGGGGGGYKKPGYAPVDAKDDVPKPVNKPTGGKYSDNYTFDASGAATSVYVRGMGPLPAAVAERYIDQGKVVQKRDSKGKIYFEKR